MINEAERYKSEDEANKRMVEARNKLESLLYQSKSSFDNRDIASKLESNDLEMGQAYVKEGLDWLEEESERTEQEYEDKLTELNGLLNPILMKVYSGGEMPSSEAQSVNPVVDEID